MVDMADIISPTIPHINDLVSDFINTIVLIMSSDVKCTVVNGIVVGMLAVACKLLGGATGCGVTVYPLSIFAYTKQNAPN